MRINHISLILIIGISEQAVMPKKTKVIEILIPEEYENYIRSQYGIIPRREIARQLNLNKVTLNLMIMNLGLAEKELVQHNNHSSKVNNEHYRLH